MAVRGSEGVTGGGDPPARGDPLGPLLRFIQRRPATFALLFTVACLAIYTLVLLGYFGAVDLEERRVGNLPKDLLEGLVAPLRPYVPLRREGGLYPLGLFTVPFFALLGPSLFALKLAAAWLVALLLWPWMDLARRLGGPRAGLAMALLLALPFPFFMRMTLDLIVGTHLGTPLLAGLALWFVYRGFGDGTLGWLPASLGAGLVLGLGAFWTFSFWPVAAAIVLVALLLRAPLRALGAGALAALPGLALLWHASLAALVAREGGLWTVIREGRWRRLGVDDSPVVTATLGSIAEETWRLITDHLPRMAGFVPRGAPASELALHPSWIYYALILASLGLVAAAWLRARRAGTGARPFALLARVCLPLPLYLAVYLTSGLYPENQLAADRYRYLLPVVPFALLLVAFAAGRALPRLAGRRAPLAGAAAALLLAGLGVASALNVAEARIVPTPYRVVRGYNLVFFFRDPLEIVRHPDWPRRGLRMAGRRDYRDLAYALGVADALAEDRDLRADPREDVPGLDVRLWTDYWEGYGAGVRQRWRRAGRPLEYLREMAARGTPGRRRAFFRGFVMGPIYFFYADLHGRLPPRTLERVTEGLPARVREQVHLAALEAYGMAERYQPLFPGDPGKLSPREMDAYAGGAGASLARLLVPGSRWPAGRPLPLRFRDLAAAAPRGFWRAAHTERDRIADLVRVFAARAPLTGP